MRAVALACLVAAASSVLRAQSEVGAIVDRAAAYVEEFQRRFGSMVAEERYEQSIQEAMAIGARTRGQFERVTLVSDFLLVQVPGEGWTPFRDVFERNGQKVRDREERLAKLFLEGSSRSSFDQARQIMLESSRYNIGNIERTINQPTLPLLFVTSALRGHFKFELEKLRIEAEKQFRIAAAEALGNMLAKANMQIFGDPTTMAQMSEKFMRAAADLEDKNEKHIVTPGRIVPARELLGDMLLEMKQPKAALAEFEASQQREPNRYRNYAGAARAAELSGDRVKAAAYYQKLLALAKDADTPRPELASAKQFASSK